MAKSDKKGCPKGGWADYRSGPWYNLLAGVEQGGYMKDKHEKAYGHGAHADKPYRCGARACKCACPCLVCCAYE